MSEIQEYSQPQDEIQHQPQPNLMTQDQVNLLKRTVCKGSSDDEFELFKNICRRTGLDPFQKQIHAVFYNVKGEDGNYRRQMSIQTGIDGFRSISQRTGMYEGESPVYWCGKDGEWKDVWLLDENPYACKAGVYKKGAREPIIAIVYWEAVVQKNPSTKEIKLHWLGKKGVQQIAKCAKAAAHRAAFPFVLGGIYAPEEMESIELPHQTSVREKNEDLENFLNGIPDDVLDLIRAKKLTKAQVKQIAKAAELDSTRFMKQVEEYKAVEVLKAPVQEKML